MPVVNYLTLDGEILSETRNGIESDYLPDTLGSTYCLLNSSQVITDKYTYWPYGEVRSHTGSSVTPYTFCGTLGYHSDGNGLTYVRSRYLRPALSGWQTVDPLWPTELAYLYGDGGPATNTDQAGLQVRRPHYPYGHYGLRWPIYDPNPLPDKWGYGNWCGKSRPPAGGSDLPPVDAMDDCCRCHDADLGNCACGGYTGAAHHKLVQCVKSVDCKKSEYPKLCSAAQKQLLDAFNSLVIPICDEIPAMRCPVHAPPCSPNPPPPNCPPPW